jgi:pantoate kinase
VGGETAVRAGAFAPGHVTGAFCPRTEHRDPRGRGSVGVGLVLEAGVYVEATWVPSRNVRVAVTGDRTASVPISEDVARRLIAHRPGRLTVRFRRELPVGQGFGTSAADALATALAVGRVVGASRRRSAEVAHLAELFGGGGLGGVAAILDGGLERRLRPGVPPFGRVVHRPFPDPVLILTVGPPMPSPGVLSNARTLARIAAAYDAVEPLGPRPTPEAFWSASERFTDRLRLAPPGVAAVVRAIRSRGGRAAQAMFGRSVVAALPRGRRREELVAWLMRRGLRGAELRTAAHGARTVPIPQT